MDSSYKHPAPDPVIRQPDQVKTKSGTKAAVVRILKWTGIVAGGALLLSAILLFVATRWLTPERLSDLIDREASKQMNADVRTHNPRYSFSFDGVSPVLRLELDSVCIRSRDLDNLPAATKRLLPADADLLFSSGRLSATIDVAKLAISEYRLSDIDVESLRVNIVQVNDSLNNYNILPRQQKEGKIPYFNISGVKTRGKHSISFTDLPTRTAVDVRLNDLTLKPGKQTDSYSISMPGTISGRSGNFKLPGVVPFSFDGDVRFRFNPFDVSTMVRSFKLQGMGTTVDVKANAGDLASNPKVSANISTSTDLKDATELTSIIKDCSLAGKLNMNADVSFQVNGRKIDKAVIGVKADAPGMSLHHDGLDLALKGLKVKISAAQLKKPREVRRFEAPARWSADSASLRQVRHTPELLTINLNDTLRELMRHWDVKAEVDLDEAGLSSKRYRADNRLRNLCATATLDSVVLHRIAFSSGNTSGFIAAHISNLRQFLASPTPAPIRLSLRVDFDTLQINQLSRVYALSNPGSAIASGDSHKITGHLEQKAYILPRNIVADIHASAKQVRYINLHLYDLSTDIGIADGVAGIDTLQLAADFCKAGANVCYDTSDLQKMSAAAKLDINDINVVKLLQNFESIERKFPAIANLTAMLGVHADARMLIFPDMYMNVPSLWANANVKVWDLSLRQNKFIHHIANMLMIYGNEDLKVADMDIHAALHSNLLQVFPFDFEMSKYKLHFEGLNNLNGDLYYHIGVDKWPLRLPFGVNIKGTYAHPLLRFGGRHWHDKNSLAVTSDIESHNRVNLLSSTVKYGTAIVHTAATYRE